MCYFCVISVLSLLEKLGFLEKPQYLEDIATSPSALGVNISFVTHQPRPLLAGVVSRLYDVSACTNILQPVVWECDLYCKRQEVC